MQHYILQSSSFSEIRKQSSFAPGAGALYGEEEHSHRGHLCVRSVVALSREQSQTILSHHTLTVQSTQGGISTLEKVWTKLSEGSKEKNVCALRKVPWLMSPCLAQIEARLGSTQATVAVSSCVIQGCDASPRVRVQSQTIKYGRKKDVRRKQSWHVPGKQPKTWTIGMPQGVPLPWYKCQTEHMHTTDPITESIGRVSRAEGCVLVCNHFVACV